MRDSLENELSTAADTLLSDLQRLPFLAQVDSTRLRPLATWAANLGLTADSLARVVWVAGTRYLAGLDEGTEDIIAAVAGPVRLVVRDNDELPF